MHSTVSEGDASNPRNSLKRQRSPTNGHSNGSALTAAATSSMTATSNEAMLVDLTNSAPSAASTTTPPSADQQYYNIATTLPTTEHLHALYTPYTGAGLIQRLVFIGEQYNKAIKARKAQNDSNLQQVPLELFHRAVKLSKAQQNAVLYNDVLTRIRESIASTYSSTIAKQQFPTDEQWINQITQATIQQSQKLEQQLLIARRDGERESQYNALLAQAEHSASRGDYNTAVSKYLDVKDFTPPNNGLEQYQICMAIINTSITSGMLSHVRTQAQRAKAIVEVPTITGAMSRLNAALALFNLKNNNYTAAAEHFIQAKADLADTYTDVITCKDIALYGTITALASFNRVQLKSELLNNTEFNKLLDDVPECRTMIQTALLNQYHSLYQQLDAMLPMLQYDYWLAPHAMKLFRNIKDAALLNHVKPYSSISMQAVATAFGLNVTDVESRLADMILDNRLDARIDGAKKVLIAKKQDKRSQMYTDAIKAGEKYIADGTSLLLRMSLIDAGIIVAEPKKKQQQIHADQDDATPDMT